MTRKTVGYVHLEWTCPRCETRNPGPQKFCNGCGSPQPEDVEFHQAAEEQLITDAAEIARAKAGPDVHCPYCGARNPGIANFCGACGGDLKGGEARARGRVLGAYRDAPAAEISCPACGQPNPATAQRCRHCGASLVETRPERAEPAGAPARAPVKALLIAGGVLVLIAAIVGFIALTSRTKEIIGSVQEVNWKRSVAIEAMGPVEHEGWLDEIPSDAEVGTCELERHHTADEPAPNATEVCGTPYTVDTGSGFGEVVQDCEYEVYEERCTYTQLEWIEIDQVSLTGSDLNPLWPQVSLEEGQRQGESVEVYKVVFDSNGKAYTYAASDPDEFSRFSVGSSWILNVNAFNAVRSVDPVD